MGCKNLFIKTKKRDLSKPFGSWIVYDSKNKEDIKMDVQKKIKILKYFVDGVAKTFL